MVKIRALSIINYFSRMSPALDVRIRYGGADVARTVDRLATQYGRPQRIRLDNGPKFISKNFDLWGWTRGIVLDFGRPEKPTNNAFIETFNGHVRSNASTVEFQAWRVDYNEFRPHSSLGKQIPKERAFASGQACLSR